MSETWFNEFNIQNIPNYCGFHTLRLSGRSGGVSVYVLNSLISRSICSLCISNITIELCTVEVTCGSDSFVLLGIYRPHSDSVINFSDFFSTILNNEYLRGKKCIAVGDFNVNLLSLDSSAQYFGNSMYSSHFIPLISKPTHFPVNSNIPTLLDHIWVNYEMKYTCGVINIDLTDHCPIFLNLSISTNVASSLTKKISFRLVNDENKSKFLHKVANYSWFNLFSSNIENFTLSIVDTLNKFYCQNFPLKYKNVKKIR